MSMSKSSVSSKGAAAPARARLDAEVDALTEANMVKVPPHADAHRAHLEGLSKAAARDVDELCAVALPDGAVEAWEVAALPFALAEVKALAPRVKADGVASGVELTRADAKLLAGVRAAQSKVSWAFRRLRFRGDAARIKELDAIDAGDPADAVDAHRDSERLIAIALHANERGWFSSLKCGEPEALAALQRDHEALAALAEKAKGSGDAAARKSRLRRVWTVITRIERHLRDAADYRYRNDPKRDDYRAYTPVAKARYNKSVVAANAKRRADAKKAAADAQTPRKTTG